MKAVRILLICALSLLWQEVEAAESMTEYTTTPSGLRYIITHRGLGPRAKSGDIIVYRSIGRLEDGRVFEDSRTAVSPKVMQAGKRRGQVVGLQEGLELLRAGDRAAIIVPPQLGYGRREFTPLNIPADATLHYELEIIAVKTKQLVRVVKEGIDAGGIRGGRETFDRLKANNFPDVYEGEEQLRYLGFAYLSRQDRLTESRAVFEWNAELYPRSAKTHGDLAMAYLLNDMVADAAREYRIAIELEPEGPQAKNWQTLLDQLSDRSKGLPKLELLRMRIGTAGLGLSDASITSNMPMAVGLLQKQLQDYIADAPSSESEDAAKLVTLFFEIVERNRPELLKSAVDSFMANQNEAARRSAETKRSSMTP